MGKDMSCDYDKKKSGVVILRWNKVDSVAQKITINKEGNYIIIIGSIYWEDKTILNVYVPNSKTLT